MLLCVLGLAAAGPHEAPAEQTTRSTSSTSEAREFSSPRPRTEERIQFYLERADQAAVTRTNERNTNLDAYFAARERTRQLEKFTIKKGGSILTRDFGKIRAELGVWLSEDGRGLCLLRFSW